MFVIKAVLRGCWVNFGSSQAKQKFTVGSIRPLLVLMLTLVARI
jgi:hypothetical protein